MAISSQLPQIFTAARAGALQALALQAGQTVEGQVIGPAPNGGTQVQIAGRMLNLVLPMLVATGETLKFEVQGNGAQVKLALQPAVPATTPGQTPQHAPSTQATLPLPPTQPPASAQPTPASSATTTGATPLRTTVQMPVASGSAPTGLATPHAAAALPGAAQPQAQAGSNKVFQPVAVTPASATFAKPPALLNPVPAAIAQPAAPIPLATPASLQQAKPAANPYPQATSVQPAAKGPSGTPPIVPFSPPTPSEGADPTHPPTALRTTPAPAPASRPAQPSSPQAALAQMVQSSLPRQDSVANLVTALTSIAGKVALPEPVIRAAQQVLAARTLIEPGKLDGAALQKAVLNSGIFLEAGLASGQVPGAQPDQKSVLLALRQTLLNWLGPQVALTPASQIAPPLRGQVPRARASDPRPLEPDAAPQDIGKQLLERTEASLSRLRLHQNASLPDPAAKTSADWSMDLPVLVGTQQSVLHLQIHRDGEDKTNVPAERGWQMLFALSLPQLGEVGARVSLRGGATGVMLWATDSQTSQALEAHLAALRQTLAEIGLRPGSILVRHGEPPSSLAAVSGYILDART